MTISLIIPNYNGAHLIEKNLPKVLASVKKYDVSVIIVDDSSDIDDFMRLEGYIDSVKKDNNVQIKLLKNEKNYGFAKTVNVGAKHADSDLLLFLNSDVIPDVNFLDSVLPKFIEDEMLFAVGCMDKSIEKSEIILRGRGVGKFEKGFLLHRKGDTNKENTLWVSGGSSIVRNSIFKALGGFDEIYNPFYWEDIDLSYRAQKSGYRIVFDNKSIVEHRHEEGAIKSNFSSTQVKTIAYRNQIIFVWKNITDKSLLMQHFLYLPLHIGRSLISGDWIFLKGLMRAIFLLPAVLKKRSKNRQKFVKSDHEVLSPFV